MSTLTISYAQAMEDLHLAQALADVPFERGFYIDVGANDPEIDSVTKHFYDRGWRGINIDASPKWAEKLRAQRPRDVNIEAAISDLSGPLTFYDHIGGLGTTIESIARSHESLHRHEMVPRLVATSTLTDVCAAHAPAQIHFLKIDVEGSEDSVLRSMDFGRFRPWILCIECHYPNRPDVQVYDAWESIVVDADYLFAFTDSINRYYVAAEQRERLASFSYPAQFCLPAQLARQIQDLERRVKTFEHCMGAIRKIAETAVT